MPFLKRGGGVGTGPAAGGGGGNPVRSSRAEPVAFYANWTDIAAVQADAFADAAANVMAIPAAGIRINQGGFAVETAGGVSEVVFPEAGLYSVSVHAEMGGGGGRTNLEARIRHTRGAVVSYGLTATGGYLRGTATLPNDQSSVVFEQPVQILAGDKITIQVINTADLSLPMSGNQSWIYIRREEGRLTVSGSDGGGVGDATGGLLAASENLLGEIRVDQNTLIEYACVRRYHYTAAATGTWADIPARADLDIVDDRRAVAAVENRWIYETDDNQFFAGTLIAPNRVDWIHDSPDNALAASLAVGANSVHWFGEHENDAQVLALMTELEDDTEYFYFNVHSQTPRRLTNNTFVAADSPIEYFTWLPVRADPSAPNGGFVVDVSEEHHPPPPDKANRRNLYFDRIGRKLWIPDVIPAAGTPPEVTANPWTSNDDALFRPAAYVNPDEPQVAGAHYYNRTSHNWRLKRQGHFYPVTWREIAMNTATIADDAVWLGEVASNRRAAEVLAATETYDATEEYFFIVGRQVRKLDTYTPPVDELLIDGYLEINVDDALVDGGSDDTIVAVAANQLVATDIDRPTSTWAWFNPGGKYGTWVRVLVADIPDDGEAATDVSADATKALSFPLDSSAEWFLAANAAGKITTGGSDATKFPTNLQMRTD